MYATGDEPNKILYVHYFQTTNRYLTVFKTDTDVTI